MTVHINRHTLKYKYTKNTESRILECLLKKRKKET